MNVLFNDDAKAPLIQGVKLIGDAVASTFGPNGRNVIIKTRSGNHITKDGATVARAVNHNDPFVEMGIEAIRDIAVKTAKDVGDGSSTSTILAREIVLNLIDSKLHPIEILRTLENDLKKVIDYLEENKLEISTEEDLLKVATISANNDPILGKLIANTYHAVGKDGIVTMEESTEIHDSVVYTTGLQIDNGYSSPYFINTDKNTCELNNVLVFISIEKLSEVTKQLISVCDQAIRERKTLLLMAPDIDSSILRMLLLNKGNKLDSCTVINPGNGIFRDILLDDIRVNLGETMTCEKVVIAKDTTTFIGCNISDETKSQKIAEIKQQLSNTSLSEFEVIFNKKRLANYVGGIATILVGGYSKAEIIEKKDRVEDAIAAVKAALDGGVLPGGGSALLHASVELDLEILGEIIKTPFRLLEENSGYFAKDSGDYNFWEGVNFKTLQQGNMYKMGIIDPFLVTKIALQNAVTAASLILTTSCSIINLD